MSLSSFQNNFCKSAFSEVTEPANTLKKLDCFILRFNENVILTTAITFETQKQKTTYSRKDKTTYD